MREKCSLSVNGFTLFKTSFFKQPLRCYNVKLGQTVYVGTKRLQRERGMVQEEGQGRCVTEG